MAGIWSAPIFQSNNFQFSLSL